MLFSLVPSDELVDPLPSGYWLGSMMRKTFRKSTKLLVKEAGEAQHTHTHTHSPGIVPSTQSMAAFLYQGPQNWLALTLPCLDPLPPVVLWVLRVRGCVADILANSGVLHQVLLNFLTLLTPLQKVPFLNSAHSPFWMFHLFLDRFKEDHRNLYEE